MVTQFGVGRMIKLAYICFGLSIFGLVNHWFVTGGIWFQWEQFWHHESLISLAFWTGIVLILVCLHIERMCRRCTDWDWVTKHTYKSENIEQDKEG